LSGVGGGIGESRADEAEIGTISINTAKDITSTSSDEPDIPVGIVDLDIGAEKLLLARLVGIMPTDLITVLLGL
jgi:hypothetical protein